MLEAAMVAREQAGWWVGEAGSRGPESGDEALRAGILAVDQPLYVVDVDGELAVARDGMIVMGGRAAAREGLRAGDGVALRGYLPALHPERLGDAGFREAHGLRYAYVAGEMANAIGSEEIVEAMGQAGMIGFFGAAGCSLERVEAAIERIQRALGERPYGFNLIHSPSETWLEDAVVDLYLRRGVRLICASAYLDLTLPLIRYRVSGIHRDENGDVVTPNKVIAKVSRVEVARKFFSPPPGNMLAALVAKGVITDEQAEMAAGIPVAEDLTAEADSGGHTDNRPAITLLPTMLALRDAMSELHGYSCSLRVGAAGGIATPASAAAAFAMGAAYVLTGSINQACVEAGTSDSVREMLAAAEQADVMMAPAADMFEMGVNVQVLKRGTMFGMRARKLYELYRAYESLEAVPPAQMAVLERDYFRKPVDEIWEDTRAFFMRRDPKQVERAEREPRHKMALIFRSYLGQTSKWANAGDASRKIDYQVWCGPAMGAFNEWARGSFLEEARNRGVVVVGLNLMLGAAVLTRVAWLRAQGVSLPASVTRFGPMERRELDEILN